MDAYIAAMIGLIERLTASAAAIETVIYDDHTPASTKILGLSLFTVMRGPLCAKLGVRKLFRLLNVYWTIFNVEEE